MPRSLSATASALLIIASLSLAPSLTVAQNITLPTDYPNAFVDPRFILNKSAWNPGSLAARNAIINGSFGYAEQGPWSVVNKTILPPSNNIHDYLSYAPYYWPDCSNVHNKTVLTQQQINNECKFVNRDGQFVPDQYSVNNRGDIYTIGDAVFYAAMAWSMTGDGVHAANIAHWIDTWFINNATAQTPNMNFAQLVRGVGENVGVHTGLLDFKGMSKLATGVLTLRLGNATEWTEEVDNGFKGWLNAYLPWLVNDMLAVQERETPNNHGSFYYNQLASVYLLLDDQENARATLEEYFNGIYQNQITGTGEQPLEAERADPIHYRAYNLAAMITNARLADYIGYSTWNISTKTGGNIQKATDFAMAQNPAPSHEQGAVYQMWQIVACIATVYGDPTGKYKQYLSVVDPSEAFFFWDFHATINSTSTTTSSSIGSQPSTSSKQKGGAVALSPRISTLAAPLAVGLGAAGLLASLW